MLVEWQGVDK
uniref:Uncharacterized protein n=1 Tax=Arundo donax TaxID=35708 RepID=A0A0A9E9P2_ARUDO